VFFFFRTTFSDEFVRSYPFLNEATVDHTGSGKDFFFFFFFLT